MTLVDVVEKRATFGSPGRY